MKRRWPVYALTLQWNRYLECSILPSPKLEADLNTYLMLWDQELLEFESPPSTSSITSKLPAAMKLMEAMESEMGEMIDLERLEKASALHSYMVRLLQIILKKWFAIVADSLGNYYFINE